MERVFVDDLLPAGCAAGGAVILKGDVYECNDGEFFEYVHKEYENADEMAP